MFFIDFNGEKTLEFDFIYPKFERKIEIENMKFFDTFNGKVNNLVLFKEPIEVDKHKRFGEVL